MTRVHVSMIVRNEEGRFLERALATAREITTRSGGTLAVTDDASTDATPDICRDYGAQLRQNEVPKFWEHEGRARQENYEFVSRSCNAGDWVLSLDADESVNDPALLLSEVEVAAREAKRAVLMPLYEFWDDDHYRVDGFWFGTKASRLYAWQPNGTIQGKVMACGSEPTYVASAVVRQQGRHSPGLHLQHWGYSRETDRIRKHAAYSDRLGGHGHNDAHVQSIIGTPKLRRYL